MLLQGTAGKLTNLLLCSCLLAGPLLVHSVAVSYVMYMQNLWRPMRGALLMKAKRRQPLHPVL